MTAITLATKEDVRELRHEMKEMEGRITNNIIKWIVGLFLAQTVLIITVVLQLVQ